MACAAAPKLKAVLHMQLARLSQRLRLEDAWERTLRAQHEWSRKEAYKEKKREKAMHRLQRKEFFKSAVDAMDVARRSLSGKSDVFEGLSHDLEAEALDLFVAGVINNVLKPLVWRNKDVRGADPRSLWFYHRCREYPVPATDVVEFVSTVLPTRIRAGLRFAPVQASLLSSWDALRCVGMRMGLQAEEAYTMVLKAVDMGDIVEAETRGNRQRLLLSLSYQWIRQLDATREVRLFLLSVGTRLHLLSFGGGGRSGSDGGCGVSVHRKTRSFSNVGCDEDGRC